MPTDYSKASIYRLLCDDGRFYIGSTVLSLSTRFGQHRRAVDNGSDSKVYKHVRSLGGPDKMRIDLVATDLNVKTRDELLKVEDFYIRLGLKNKLCLNRNKPRATSEERIAREEAQTKMWHKINRDAARDAQAGKTPMSTGDRVREYYRTHRRISKPKRIKSNPEGLVECECGWDVMRAQLAGHRKKKEHLGELMRWYFLKKILQRANIILPDRTLPTWLSS
jgi:hypothetical protein